MNGLQTKLRQATLALSAVLGASAIGLAILAATASAWFVLGFEAVVLINAVIGLLFGRGRFPQAPAMTLALIAGGVGLCSGLAYLSTSAAGYQVGPLSMTLVLAARLALAGLFGLGAVAAVLGASGAAWARVALGTVLVLAPSVAVAAAFSDVGEPLTRRISAMGPAVAVGIAAAAFLVWVGLVSAGGHMIITSFERALPAPWESSDDPARAA